MFKTRLLSGIVLVIAAAALLTLGGNALLAGLFIISLVGMYELNKVMNVQRCGPGIAAYLMAAVYYALVYANRNEMGDRIPAIFFVVFLMLLMAVYVFTFPKYRSEQIVTAFFSLFYVGIMLSYIYRTRMLDDGYLVWLVFLASWGCDTCAYCVGVLIGKHKMAPKLSPKKSIEGAAGGIVGAALLGALFGTIFKHAIAGTLKNPAVDCAIICTVGAVISMVGDLAASAIKRNHDVKDYGKLIPGHGGILDRFDSVIFVAPGIYYTILILMQGKDIWKLFF